MAENSGISSKSTAYHGEIAAIDIALNFCKNLYGRKIFILSDCQSAIESVSNNITPDSYATLLNSIKSKSCLLNDRQCIITISWIGGHCGILGNELADKAAKSACLQALTLPPYLSMKAAKSLILQGIKLYWQKMWDTSPDGYHLKLFQPSVNLRPSYLFITNRREQLHIHHLRLGRSKLNDQDPIQKKERKDKLCNTCMEIEDTSHFLLKCTRYSIERRVLFLNIDEIYNRYNIASKDRIYNELILGDNSFIPKNASLEILQHVINYVKMTKRLS